MDKVKTVAVDVKSLIDPWAERIEEKPVKRYSRKLEDILKGVQFKKHIQDEGYLSMDTYVGISNALNEKVFDAYYDGNEEKAEYYIDKNIRVLIEMRAFNLEFGL